MTRFAICLLMALCPMAASADPQRAEAWAADASVLQGETEALIAALESGALTIGPDFTAEASAFSSEGAALGAWNDAEKGPMDLGCIFRGISEDVTRQMHALESAADAETQRAALKRLGTAFEDAALIGADAAVSWAKAGLGATDEEMLVPCKGDAATMAALLAK